MPAVALSARPGQAQPLRARSAAATGGPIPVARTVASALAGTVEPPGASTAAPLTFRDVPGDVLAAAGGLSLAAGVAVGIGLQRLSTRVADDQLKPRYPRDWHRLRDLFTTDPKDPRKPGYLELAPRRALHTGHMPFGRTFPRAFGLVPDVFPLQELRRWSHFATSRPVFLPYAKRFTHLLIAGGTGKGKSTSFIIPPLAYGALERDSAYFAVDVKSPELRRLLGPLYRRAGKDVYFLDPWSLEETLAMEPLWRAGDERRDLLADVIAGYSPDLQPVQETGNSAFFRDKAVTSIRAILELMGYWPRRYCKLPCLYQLIAAGHLAVKEAFLKARTLVPSRDAFVESAQIVVAASDDALDAVERPAELARALDVVDRAGHRTAVLIRRMRAYAAQRRAGQLAGDRLAEIADAFHAELLEEYDERASRLTALVQGQGELLNGHEETLKGVISTIATKVGWFRHPRIARVFSRDEFDVDVLTEKPCLVLIGAPMAKRNIGSLFVTSLITNLALNGVYQRGMSMQRGDRATQHGIFFALDEYAQLGIRDTPNMAMLFRGYRAGLILVIQERSVLRHLHGELSQALEGCLTHKVLFQGAHEETAKFFAQENIGECTMVQRTKSGMPGERQNVTEQPIKLPRITPTELRDMVLNGKRREGVAMSVGADAPAFPLLLIPYDQDPVLRGPDMLNLTRRLDRTGKDGRPTLRAWEWRWIWQPPQQVPPLAIGGRVLARDPRRTPTERAAGVPDPVHERVSDPYRDYVDFLLGHSGRLRRFDDLVPPRLVLGDVAVTDADPARADDAAADGAAASPSGAGAGGVADASGAAGSSTGASRPGSPSAAPAVGTAGTAPPDEFLAPAYVEDFHALLSADYEPPDLVPAMAAPGGALRRRVDAAVAADPAPPGAPGHEPYGRDGARAADPVARLLGAPFADALPLADVLSPADAAASAASAAPLWLAYDPDIPVGTVEPRPSGDAVRYVGAERYYAALVGDRIDVNKLFIHAAVFGRVPPDRRLAVDEAIATAFWDTYLGVLTPPRVLGALRRSLRRGPPDDAAGRSGDRLVDLLDHLRRELFAAPTLGDAADAHADGRVRLLLAGASGDVSERQCTVGEVLADYLLVQRGIVEDVRRADRERRHDEPRGLLLERYELEDELKFYDTLSLVHRTDRVVDRIPAARRAEVEAFAATRPLVVGPRVFARQADPGSDAVPDPSANSDADDVSPLARGGVLAHPAADTSLVGA